MTRKFLLSSPAVVLAAGFMVLFIGGGSRFAIGLTPCLHRPDRWRLARLPG